MDGQSDETLIYKASKNTFTTANTLLSHSMSTISRSKSTTTTTEDTKTYMNTLKRALTTNRSKKQSHRQKFYSFQHQEINTSPLHISLPNVEHSFSTNTPPLSPPTSIQLSIPHYLPELSQDHIIRHLSLLYINHVDIEDILDYKKSTTLWGKLKTHILTPTSDTSTNPIHSIQVIGVSLTNLSSGSLSLLSSSTAFDHWVQVCPYVKSCFSQNSLVPDFLRHCILAIIEQGKHINHSA